MKQYYDIALSKECEKFGEHLGFTKVFVNKFKIISGGSHKQNQEALRKKIDILMDPVIHDKRNFDPGMAQIAKQKNITIAISLKSILEKSRVERINYLRNIQNMLKLCQRVGVNVIIISDAKNIYHMRNPEQLASIGCFFGLTKSKQIWCVSSAYEGLISQKHTHQH